MDKKWTSVLVIVIILVFVSYIVFDLTIKKSKEPGTNASDTSHYVDQWEISKIFEPGLGKLEAVAVGPEGKIILGGSSFVSAYDADLKLRWSVITGRPVTAVAAAGDSVLASTYTTLMLLKGDGSTITEWGPFGDSSLITSIAANRRFIAIADAQNKTVYLLKKSGELVKIIGTSGEPFIIPSPFFDVALSGDDNLYVANTGNFRIERRNIEGTLLSYFGEPDMSANGFSGCCNPSHFALLPQGFVTAEKGLNRLKILDQKGQFVEFVSVNNNFQRAIPLDVASADGKTIYAANPADSKLYIFKRKVK